MERWLYTFVLRCRSLFRRRRVEEELDEELRFHLEQQIRQHMDAGLTRDEATRAARLALGGVEQQKEACRDTRHTMWIDDTRGDVRYAIRSLRRTPGFAAAAIVTLALGIGANTAIYSVLNGVLLRPAPIESLDRLVMVWETDRATGTTREPASVPDFLDYEARTRTLSGLAAFLPGEANLSSGPGDPEHVVTLAVSHTMLPMLGLRPLAGRTFSAGDDRVGSDGVVLVSQSFAGRLFGTPVSAVGRTVRLDDRVRTIVGVVPDATDFGILQVLSAAAYQRSFADHGGGRVGVWLPLQPNPQVLPRQTHPIFMMGRLSPGVSREAASSELTAIAADLERTYPSNRARGANVEALSDVIFGPIRPILFLLVAAVVVVLLIACVNVVNLLLARGSTRTTEVAVRSAIGAGLARLFRQFLAESVVFTCTAAVCGVAVAWTGMRLLLSLAPAEVPRLSTIALDGGVLGATLVVAGVVAIAFGVVPTLQARRLDLSAALKEDGGARSTGDRARLRSGLVVAELAAAVMLVSGSTLLIRSFWNLQHVDPGFQAQHVLKAEYRLPQSRYPMLIQNWPDAPEQRQFSHALLERAARLPESPAPRWRATTRSIPASPTRS